jgi:hypothetical protein
MIASSGKYLIPLLPGAAGTDTESWVGGLNDRLGVARLAR